MFKNICRLEAKAQDQVSHWFLEHNCSVDLAEQMLLQFLQYLGEIKKAAKAAQDAADEEKPKEDKAVKETQVE